MRHSIRVASVPSGHAYVRHLLPLGSTPQHPNVVHLPDPRPDDDGSPAPAQSRWWPPQMLDPAWITTNRNEFDIVHIHFGFDARSVDDLHAFVRAVRDARKPLVYTVHDLQNPHHHDQSLHASQQSVLIEAADHLITLTEGAAAEIERRWGRQATVIPHPHIVEFDTMAKLVDRPRTAGTRIGLHLKSLRANMRVRPLLDTLIECGEQTPELTVQVNGHRDILEPDGKRYEPELARLLHDAERRGAIELEIHDFFSEDAFCEHLASLDASVLPYRFGTHSGWLEACRDVGTAVIAPDCGYYADQGAHYQYTNRDEFVPDSLRDAITRLMREGAPAPLGVELRRAQRERIAAAHAEIYSNLETGHYPCAFA